MTIKCCYPEECKASGFCIRPEDHDNPPSCCDLLVRAFAIYPNRPEHHEARAAEKREGTKRP